MNAALLIFIAGVLRKVMNDMDNSTFTHFVRSLVLHSKWSPFMEITLNIPAVGAIPYFYFFGFENRWLTAGLALWLAAGLVSKMIKVPVYRMIETVGRGDEVDLRVYPASPHGCTGHPTPMAQAAVGNIDSWLQARIGPADATA